MMIILEEIDYVYFCFNTARNCGDAGNRYSVCAVFVVVFRLRLSNQVQIEGIQFVQRRVHRLIYYPVLAVAVASGAYLAVIQERISSPGNGWLHIKITLLLILIILGFVNRRQIMNIDLRNPQALLVHIGIFFVSAAMIFLVQAKPF